MLICRWCHKTLESHAIAREPGAPVSRMPCGGLQSGFNALDVPIPDPEPFPLPPAMLDPEDEETTVADGAAIAARELRRS